MSSKVSRRTLVKSALVGGTLLPAFGWLRRAEAAPSDLPPLDPKSPNAVTLSFVNNAGRVDAAANPMYAPGQTCANCQQFQGNRSDSRGGCVLFAGKSVPAGGWCKVWRKTF